MEQKYSLQLERGGQGRITTRKELVNGWPVSWEYRYDGAGRLTGVNRDGAGAELYLYDAQGRRAEDYVPLRGQSDRAFRYSTDNRLLQAGDTRYEHDNRGFRSRKVTPQGETRYHYAPDYRLLAVELPDGKVVEYAHDDQGLRGAKYVNGKLTERFRWHDRAHLAAWSHADMAGGQWWEVVYGQDGRSMGLVTKDQGQGQRQGAEILLHTDQIGSVRVVEFPTEGMVKEVLYDAFGNVVKDGNPYLRSPLGFAGGLHDWDTGLVRFGWRDYDPDTGRFTAKDPIGAAGGDSDWYGYCLDDPINGRDLTGLFTDVYYYDENKGHIAIDPGGNGDPIGKYPMTDEDVFGGPGDYRFESRKPAKVVRVETTAEQERDMQEYQRMAQRSSSVHYALGAEDCVDAADTVLKVGGVNTPGSDGITYPVNYVNKLQKMK